MKKVEFVTMIGEIAKDKSRQELRELAVYLARFVPIEAFDDIIHKYNQAIQVPKDRNMGDLKALAEQLFEQVQNGQYKLAWGYFEDYDEYDRHCWEDDDTERLMDEDGFADDAQLLLTDALACVQAKDYALAADVFDILFSIELPMSDGAMEGFVVIFDQDMLDLELTYVICHYAFAVLMAREGERRLTKLLEIALLRDYHVKWKEILAVGEDEIPDQKAFYAEWIDFLVEEGAKLSDQSPRIEKLLIDSVVQSGGTQQLDPFTIRHGVCFQSAYTELVKAYLQNSRYDDAVRIIDDGLAKIKGVNRTRTVLSETLAEVGEITNRNELKTRGIEEAFYSTADLDHFLQLYALHDKEIVANGIKYMEMAGKKQFDYYAMHFLIGEYDLVWEACKGCKNYLNWSYSMNGRLLPLFIVLLAGKIGDCTRNLFYHTSVAFYPAIGELPLSYVKSRERFIKTLEAELKPLSDEQYRKYWDWCLAEAEIWATQIIGGQNRGFYHNVTELIVSLAEVLIARGKSQEAAAFILRYKNQYPKHSLFRRHLASDIALTELRTV